MKLDVTQIPVDPMDKPFKMNGEDMTLRDIMVQALGTTKTQGKSMQEAMDVYDLAVRIRKDDKVSLTIKEAKTIQDAILGCFGPYPSAAAGHLMEGCTEEPENKKAAKKDTE